MVSLKTSQHLTKNGPILSIFDQIFYFKIFFYSVLNGLEEFNYKNMRIFLFVNPNPT